MNEQRWGKAGVRKTGASSQRELYLKALAKQRKPAQDRSNYRDWHDGKVIPYRITALLNLNMLYGPKVDEACGVAEPQVDMWEDGVLYPTWEQLQLLADLCGVSPRAFMIESTPLTFDDTSMKFHLTAAQRREPPPPPPVLEFTPEAIAAATKTKPPTGRAPVIALETKP